MEIEIKKSKFIGIYYQVESAEDISTILQNLKKEYKKATHICYAYRLTSPFAEKAFDDGEPSGTAGKPILNVLQKQDKQNCLLVVVRFFGGVKLGAGGLVRAYSKTASETVKEHIDN